MSSGCRDVMVVVAHPDDETLALGGRLSRLSGIRLLHVTDGAPESMEDARALGFTRRADYAAARARELAAALARAGIPAEAQESLAVPDQGAAPRIAWIAARIAARLDGVTAVLTHALEGGHPDHDATAVAVRAACHLLRRRGPAPVVIEFPLYHARGAERVLQRFAPLPEAPEHAFPLDAAERAEKEAMLAAFVSQRATLASFTDPVERFRPAPAQALDALPNGGDLLYARFGWGLRPEGWHSAASEAREALDLPRWL